MMMVDMAPGPASKGLASGTTAMLAGRGPMSTIIIYASEKKSFAHLAIVCLLSIGVAVVTWLALRVAAKVGARLSKTTINVATRIMGLLLAALAVEIFAGGVFEVVSARGKAGVVWGV